MSFKKPLLFFLILDIIMLRCISKIHENMFKNILSNYAFSVKIVFKQWLQVFKS